MIQIEQVKFQYKKRDIDGNVTVTEHGLKGINATIRKGEFIALLGRNGSGKTTFAKLLNAILTPAEGSVLADGMDTRDKTATHTIRKQVGMVFQNPDNQMVAARIEEDTAFGPENFALQPEQIRGCVRRALKQVRMWKARQTMTTHLSGGEKQRVAIAGILALQPDYMILDEPTAMLDPEGQKEVMQEILRLNREEGKTIVLITHNREEAVLADRVILLADGEIRFDGASASFFAEEALLREEGFVSPVQNDAQILTAAIKKEIAQNKKTVSEKETATVQKEIAQNKKTVSEKETATVQKEIAQNKKTTSETGTNVGGRKPLLRLEHVSYQYGTGSVYEKQALQDVSVSLYKGEIVGLAGHNGSGKSTLIQLLNGLLLPTAGQVYFEGMDIHTKGYSKHSLRRRVGMVFQHPEHQFLCDTVYEDVAFGPKHAGFEEAIWKQRVTDALQFVELPEEYYAASPFALSGGHKRRVAIAGVLALQPDYMILDEPAAGMDAIGKRAIFDKLRTLCKKKQMGILMVSHSMEDLMEYTDRLLVLEQGAVALDMRKEEFLCYRN